ncbi:DUF4320 family protein [Bacillus pacificus]|uniref:DUF4320 family protein n=1 Tax=Bacillus pacificus TaxID=2026187 RepID=UPI00397F9615
MSETLAKGLLMTLALFFLVLVVEFIMFGAYYVKAENTASNTLKVAERLGGFQHDSAVNGKEGVNLEPYLRKQLNNNHMYPNHWSYDYTRGKVDYNKPMEILLTGEYEFHIFKILPIKWGFDPKIPINIKRTGISHVYFR